MPLHHTFEFSAGLLTPLARGARITYLSELTPKSLSRAMSMGVTSMIGVPALWQLLHRRIDGQIKDAGPVPALVLEGARNLNAMLREYFDVNLGPMLAYPVHRALGGRLKYLVSGGSALSPDVMRFFRSLGFNLTEGYGLTETAPVLTVTNPKERLIPGSVGKPLPGVELKIHEPNADGIGEVFARGPNVMEGYHGDAEATAKVLDADGWLSTGDLGRLDDKGRLFLVGRSKDVIVDLDGRNVYPDELEDIYSGGCIKEISIVGLPRPDVNAEQVAALVVPDYGGAQTQAERDAVRERVHQKLRKTSEGLPHYRRVKVAQLWDNDLPRTATRKIKRGEVLEILQRLLQTSERVDEAVQKGGGNAVDLVFLREIIHALTGRKKSDIHATTRIDTLGLDSLMVVEMQSALEEHARTEVTSEQLLTLQTVGDLLALIGSNEPANVTRGLVEIVGRKAKVEADEGTVLPKPLVALGRAALSFSQRALYTKVMDMKVVGRGYIPRHRGFLLAANHTSHLDAGLAKMALGEYGNNLVTLAAKDYFFGSQFRRTYFENFTNVLPIERNGAARQDMRRAVEKLQQGHSLLLFPEGTRSVDGELHPFKPSLGYLALTAGVPVLPMYLWGTYEAMPKGSVIVPSSRRIGAVIGPAFSAAELEQLTAGTSRSEAYRLVTEVIERAVAALRDEGRYTTDAILAEVHTRRGEHAREPEGEHAGETQVAEGDEASPGDEGPSAAPATRSPQRGRAGRKVRQEHIV